MQFNISISSILIPPELMWYVQLAMMLEATAFLLIYVFFRHRFTFSFRMFFFIFVLLTGYVYAVNYAYIATLLSSVNALIVFIDFLKDLKKVEQAKKAVKGENEDSEGGS